MGAEKVVGRDSLVSNHLITTTNSLSSVPRATSANHEITTPNGALTMNARAMVIAVVIGVASVAPRTTRQRWRRGSRQ